MKNLIFVKTEGDDAECLIDFFDYSIFHIFDKYHGENCNCELIEKLGNKVRVIYFNDYITESEYIPSDMTNEISNKDLLIERIKTLTFNF